MKREFALGLIRKCQNSLSVKINGFSHTFLLLLYVVHSHKEKIEALTKNATYFEKKCLKNQPKVI